MSSERKSVKEISGWYVKPELTPEEAEKKKQEVNAWWKRRVDLHYKSVAAEIPAKMNLELGKIAYKMGKTFPELIEIILADYMKNQGYNLKEFFANYEVGNYTGKPFPIENWLEKKETLKK